MVLMVVMFNLVKTQIVMIVMVMLRIMMMTLMFNLSQLRVLGLASQSRRSGTLRTDFSATPISSSWKNNI